MNRTAFAALAALICAVAMTGCGKSSPGTVAQQPTNDTTPLTTYDSADEATPAERRQAWITEPAPQQSTVADSRTAESANKAM